MAERTDLVERGTDEATATEEASRRAGGEPHGPVQAAAPATQPGQQPPAGGGTGGGDNPARVSLVLIAVVLMVGVVTYLGPILKPFLVAVFLYFSSMAAAGVLIRRHFSTLLAYLTLLVAGSAAVAALSVLAYGEVLAFQAAWPRYQQRILAVIGYAPGETREALREMLKTYSHEVFSYLLERGLGLLELLIMTFFYLLFILLAVGRLPDRVRRAFPDGRGEHLVSVAGKIAAGIQQFMHVKTLVSLGMGVSAAVVMALFGLQGWLLWGILFFALNYITYIGSIVACVPPVILAFLDLSSPLAATALSVLLVLLRIVWIDYIEIKMSGRHLNIDSILLFLWLAYWGWMWGVIGLILAFPMVTSLKIVLENLEATKGWATLMSDE
jgi:predicted PurR-regulated permease PerM